MTRTPLMNTGTSPAITAVDDSATSVTLIAADPYRKSLTFHNTSSARAFIRAGGAAATVAAGGHTVSLAQYGVYEAVDPTLEFRCIWASDPGDGGMSITAVS